MSASLPNRKQIDIHPQPGLRGAGPSQEIPADATNLGFRRSCPYITGTINRHRAITRQALQTLRLGLLSAADTPVEIICVIDAAGGATSCAGRPVVGDLAAALDLTQDFGGLDALVITDLKTPQDTFEAIAGTSSVRTPLPTLPLAAR